MRIALIAVNASFVHSSLAVRQLAAFCQNSLPAAASEDETAPDILVSEFTINEQTDEIGRELYLLDADFYLFSCYIWNIGVIEEIAEILGQARPQSAIGLGGPEVSYDPEKQLDRLPWVDFVIAGEGERGLLALADLSRRQSTSGFTQNPRDLLSAHITAIPGAVARSPETAGRFLYGPVPQPLELSDLPFPYDRQDPSLKNRIIYYESSRGCPYQCAYCLSSAEKGVRFKPVSQVLAELRRFWEAGVRQVKLVDRTFNADRRRAFAIWEFIIGLAKERLTESAADEKRRAVLHRNQPTVRRITGEKESVLTNFHFEITADLLRDEDIRLLNEAPPGLIQLEIGVQSTDPGVLDAISRPQDMEELYETVRRLGAPGNIHLHLDLIAGLPREDLATFRNSFNSVYALKPHAFQLGFLKLLKGTRLREEADRGDCLYRSRAPYEVLSTRWISYAELSSLKDIAWVIERYYNSGSFPKSLELLNELFETPFDAYQELAGWLREHGCFRRRISQDELTVLLFAFFGAAGSPGTQEGQEAVIRDYLASGKQQTCDWNRIRRRYSPSGLKLEETAGK